MKTFSLISELNFLWCSLKLFPLVLWEQSLSPLAAPSWQGVVQNQVPPESCFLQADPPQLSLVLQTLPQLCSFSKQPPAHQHLYFHEGPKTAPRTGGAPAMPSTGDDPCPDPAATLFLIPVYLCHALVKPVGAAVTGSVQFWDICVSCQAGMLSTVFLAPFQQQVCVHLSPSLLHFHWC